MAIHRERSGSSTLFGMFSVDPLPLPVLVLLTAALLLLLAPWFLSFKLSVKPTKGNTHLPLLATSLALVMLVRWLSSTEVSPPSFSTQRSDTGSCWGFTGCFSEGLLPFMVAALIAGLVMMGQYQNMIHGKWFLGFG